MIINSPVGRFPYEIDAVTFASGAIRVEGSMGTWPASLEIEPAELPRLAGRLLGTRGIAALGGTAALAFAVGVRAARR
jgi:hypothetical protein